MDKRIREELKSDTQLKTSRKRIISKLLICLMMIVIGVGFVSFSLDNSTEGDNYRYKHLSSGSWNSSLQEVTNIDSNQYIYHDFSDFYTLTDGVVTVIDPTSIVNNIAIDVLLINSAIDLYAFSVACNSTYKSYYLTYSYKLGRDIDYSDAASKYLFINPIGWGKDMFTGKFDGQGFTISNLFYERIDNEAEYEERFQEVIDGRDYQLVYYSLFSQIGVNGVVENVGVIDTTMIQTQTFGPMIAASAFIGFNMGRVDHVYIKDLRGESSGLIVDGNYTVSGLASVNQGTIQDCYVAINRIVASSVTLSSQNLRYITCASSTGTAERVYYDKAIIVGTYTNSIGEGLTTEEFLTDKFSYVVDGNSNGWYSNYTYEAESSSYLGIKYPVLRGFSSKKTADGNHFEIDSASNFAYFLELISKYGHFRSAKYLLVKTIDMKSVSLDGISQSKTVFTGTLESGESNNDGYDVWLQDGTKSTNNAILNLYLNTGASYEGYHCYGLFPILSGTVRNIDIVNFNINLNDLNGQSSFLETNAVGTVCGVQTGGIVENVNTYGTMSLTNSDTSTIGKTYAGGLVGISKGGKINGCTTNGTIDGGVQTNSEIALSSIGGVVGYVDRCDEISNCLNAMTINAIRLTSSSNDSLYLGGVIGSGYTNECFELQNNGTINVGVSGSNYYYGKLYVAGVIGLHQGSVYNTGKFLNNGDINFYVRHLDANTSAYVSGTLNVQSSQTMIYTNVGNCGTMNVVNDVGGTVTAANPNQYSTSATIDLHVSGNMSVISTNVEASGVYTYDSHYEYVNNVKEVVASGPQEIDISIISEYAPCVVSYDMTGKKITLKRSYNYRDINYVTTQVVNFYFLKFSGNCSGKNFTIDNARNDGNITVNFTKNANTALNGFLNEAKDYKKLKLYGIYEENSVGCTGKNLYNGGNLTVTMTDGLDVYYNVYVSGICYKNDGGADYFTRNNLKTTDVMMPSGVEGTLYNCVNNGDITIGGTRTYNAGYFFGVTRVGGITSVNASIISNCFNLGNIYNINYVRASSNYAGEFEVESGGITFLMLDQYAQILDSANNGKVFSINTSNASSWVNASGIAARNDKNEAGKDLSSLSGLNHHRQKIQYTINYGDVYAYNMQSDNPRNDNEQRCKAAGFLSLGVCNIVNVINYGSIYSTSVSGGMYGLVFIYKFKEAADADGNRVYIANAINYGKIQAMTIDKSKVPTIADASSFTYTTHADGSYPSGALIGYIAENSETSSSSTLRKIVISYLINFNDDVNIVGRTKNMTVSESDATVISNSLRYMATTKDTDTSPAPFNINTSYGYGIKSYSKDTTNPGNITNDPTDPNYYTKTNNGGIFNENYGLRNTDVVDNSIITNSYIADYIQFVGYSKVNDYLVEKIGLSGSIFAAAYQGLINNYDVVYKLLNDKFKVDTSKLDTLYDYAMTNYTAYFNMYSDQIAQHVVDYLLESDDEYAILAILLDQTKGSMTDVSQLVSYEHIDVIVDKIIGQLTPEQKSTLINNALNSGDFSSYFTSSNLDRLMYYIDLMIANSSLDQTSVNNLLSTIINDKDTWNKYIYSDNEVTNNLLNKISINSSSKALSLFDDLVKNNVISDNDYLNIINSLYGLTITSLDELVDNLKDTDFANINDSLGTDSYVNSSLATLSSKEKLILPATANRKLYAVNDTGYVNNNPTIYLGPYSDVNGTTISLGTNQYYLYISSGTTSFTGSTSNFRSSGASGGFSDNNLSFSYTRNGGTYVYYSQTATNLVPTNNNITQSCIYGTRSGVISIFYSFDSIKYTNYINYVYSNTPNATSISTLQAGLNALSLVENKYVWENVRTTDPKAFYDYLIYIKIVENYNNISTVLNNITQKADIVNASSTLGVSDYQDSYVTIHGATSNRDMMYALVNNGRIDNLSSSVVSTCSTNLRQMLVLLNENGLLTDDNLIEIAKNGSRNEILLYGLNGYMLAFSDVKELINHIIRDNTNNIVDLDNYLNDETKKRVLTQLLINNQTGFEYVIDSLYGTHPTDLDSFMSFLDEAGINPSDFTDYTGIYALASSQGIENGQFIPDNIKLIDLDIYDDYNEEGTLINDPTWRGGTKENPNSYIKEDGSTNTDCVNYKVYYQMKQLKKSIATTVFKIELVDDNNNYITNDVLNDYDVKKHVINFYIPVNDDVFKSQYLTINTESGSYELSNLASFDVINNIEIPSTISAGDILTTTFIVQAEDTTVKTTYTINVYVTKAKSVNSVQSIKVNGQTATYTGSVESINVSTPVDAVGGSITVVYNTINIQKNIYMANNIKILNATTLEEVDLFSFNEETENNCIVISDGNYDLVTNTWPDGTLTIDINFDDSMPSGTYILRCQLTEDKIYDIRFTIIPSSESSVLSFVYNGQEVIVSGTSETSYIKYGTIINQTDLVIDGVCQYLDSLVISPLATYEITNTTVTETNGIKTYSITYIITAEDGTTQSTFTHNLVEQTLDKDVKNVYVDGTIQPTPTIVDNNYSYTFVKSKTPSIFLKYDLSNGYFLENSQYLVVESNDTSSAYSLEILEGQGFTVSFTSIAESKDYTFRVFYRNTEGHTFGTETLNWEYELCSITITKEKNTRSYLENVTFISETVITSIDTVITNHSLTSEEYNTIKNQSNREVVCLPSGIYYNDYEYVNVTDSSKQSAFYVVGLVNKTNLSSYSPVMDLPDDGTIYRVIAIGTETYKYVPYTYIEGGEEIDTYFLVNEGNNVILDANKNTVTFTGDYQEFTSNGITYTISLLAGKTSITDSEGNIHENITLKEDFSPQTSSDGTIEFNYIQYRIYSEIFQDKYDAGDSNKDLYYTDYFIAVQDITNNIKFNIIVRQADGLDLSSNICTYLEFTNYQSQDATFDSLDDCTILSSKMGMFAYYQVGESQLVTETFQTSTSGKYEIFLDLTREYSFRLTYSDAGETFSDIESQDNKVAILIQGSLLAKVVTIEIEIYKNNSATADWGQHLEFDMFK